MYEMLFFPGLWHNRRNAVWDISKVLEWLNTFCFIDDGDNSGDNDDD